MGEETHQLLSVLDKVGTVGLGFMLWMLLGGRLITRREFDAVVQQRDRLEQRLEKALDYGARAIDAGSKLIDKQTR